MIRRPPRSTRTDTLFPYTTLFRSFPLKAVTRHQAPGPWFADVNGTGRKIKKQDAWRDIVMLTEQITDVAPQVQPGPGYVVQVQSYVRCRSDARRVGKECVSTFRSWWSPCH